MTISDRHLGALKIRTVHKPGALLSRKHPNIKFTVKPATIMNYETRRIPTSIDQAV